MGAAESRSALSALASEDDAAPDRLVRVPGSLTGGQAELRAAAAALIAQCGGALPGVEERGGIELEVSCRLNGNGIGWPIDRLVINQSSINQTWALAPHTHRSPTSRRWALGTAVSPASR